MSTLHTRGYRPRPGEREGSWFRGQAVSARSLWPAWWGHVRANREGPDRRDDGTVASRLNRLARECLDDRDAPDHLDQRARWRVVRLLLKRGTFVLPKARVLTTPEAPSWWSRSPSKP